MHLSVGFQMTSRSSHISENKDTRIIMIVRLLDKRTRIPQPQASLDACYIGLQTDII